MIVQWRNPRRNPRCLILDLLLAAMLWALFVWWLLWLCGGMLHAQEVHPGDAQGNAGEGHGQFHLFYQNLYNNKMGTPCCSNKDCRPTTSRMVGDHIEVRINGQWRKVDDQTIMPTTAPDWGAHVCAGEPTSMHPDGRVYCVILPPQS